MKLKKVEKMQTNTFLINEENSQQRIDRSEERRVGKECRL